MNREPLIQNVSDTALWVAMYRAIESERPDAHFHDPYARRLAGERGEAMLRAMKGRSMAWPMVVRTVAFDDMLIRLVRDQGADTVVDLAAGLDARPWRLPLPAALRWYDVDLPDMLAFKTRQLANDVPNCRYEARAADLRDGAARRALFDEIGASATKAVIMTEGLLVYLEEAQVAELARDLAGPPSFRWWMMDLVSPRVLQRMQRRVGARLARVNAPFRFAPAEGTGFFARFGWREREFHSMLADASRLRRETPALVFWKLIARLAPKHRRGEWLRHAGNVLLERGTSER